MNKDTAATSCGGSANGWVVWKGRVFGTPRNPMQPNQRPPCTFGHFVGLMHFDKKTLVDSGPHRKHRNG